MKVVITGGCGFLGQRLALALLARGALRDSEGAEQALEEIVLFDVTQPSTLAAGLSDPRVRVVAGDISDKATVAGLIDRPAMSVFHLASVVSGEGERNFDLAMRVNLDGGRNVLDVLRACGGRPKLVFASSLAAYGGANLPDTVDDTTKLTPQTTYGITKAVCELLINDMSRKGFIDGRSARLPTVIIRPGKPNAAASSFVSGILREPLNGVDCILPVVPETRLPVTGYRAVIDGLIGLHELPGEVLGDDRAIGLPALNVTAGEMLEALARAGEGRAIGRVSVKRDAFIETIVGGWPKRLASLRAQALGLVCEADLDEIIRYFIADYVDGAD